MNGLMTVRFDEISKIVRALEPYKTKCKCGHTMYIIKQDRKLCRWCGHYAYKDKFTEMKYELEKRGIYGRR